MSGTDIAIGRHGRLGRITLDRPKALNALSFGMLEAMTAALQDWELDPDIAGILIEGAGPRGLCAGGDIRWLQDRVRSGQPEQADEFFRIEYRLNARIARYPKPYVAIMDGVVMGGGVGVSAHGSVRIVTERTRLAMPEVAIGFVPDIGGTFLLARAPGELGTHLALTGDTIGGSDAILCGLADHYVVSDRLPALVDALAGCGDRAAIERCVALHATEPPPSFLAGEAGWIDATYDRDSVPEILRALAARPEAAAQSALARLAAGAPVSLVVTLRALRAARRIARLEPCLEQEFRLATGLLRRSDMLEGVRAVIIDKDRNPAWAPARLADVDPAEIDALFRFDASLGLEAG